MRRSLSCSCYLVWAAAECKHKYVASATLGRGSLYTYTSVRTRGVCSIRPVAAPCFPGPCDDPTVTTHVASGPTQTRPLVLTRSNSGTGTADADWVWEAKRQFLTQAAHAPSKVGKRLVREDRDSRVLRFPRTDSGASRFPPPSGLIFVHPSLKGSVMRITCRWNGPSCSLRIHPSSSRRQAASV